MYAGQTNMESHKGCTERRATIRQSKSRPVSGHFNNKIKVKFLFIAISGISLGIFEGSHGSHRAQPEPMCLPTMTQAGREHMTQCIRLVHTNVLHIAPQRQTMYVQIWISLNLHHSNNAPLDTERDPREFCLFDIISIHVL